MMPYLLLASCVWAWLATLALLIWRRVAAQQKAALATLLQAAPRLSRDELRDALRLVTTGTATYPAFTLAAIERALQQPDGARP